MNDLMYRVTFRCNKHCYFCYNDAFEEKVNFDEIEKKDIDDLLSFIKKNNIKRVTITGGEPSVRSDLSEIIKQLTEITTVRVFTNGNLFDVYSIDEIVKFNINKIILTLYDEDIKGNAKFDNLLNKIVEVRKRGIIVDCNAFLDINFNKKRDLILARGLLDKFDHIRFQPLALTKAFKNYKDTVFGMDSKTRKKIFAQVIQDNWGDTKIFYEAFDKWLDDGIQPYECIYPITTFTVDPDLSLKTCPHKNYPSYNFENILEACKKEDCTNCLTPECTGIYKFKVLKK